MTPLTSAELEAAAQRHRERVNALRERGWQSTPKITRSIVADLTLDRWMLKNQRRTT